MEGRWLVVTVALVVLALALGGGWYWYQSRQLPVEAEYLPLPAPEETPAPVVRPMEVLQSEAPPVAEPEVETAPPAPVLPGLNSSDDFVREQVLALGEGPLLAQWLDRDELVRRFAVVLDNARKGEIPKRQLTYLAPSGPFPVLREGDLLRLDPAGYQRYDAFVTTVTATDPAASARLLRTLAPLLSQALAELGIEDPDPLAALRQALTLALATPVVAGPIPLEQPSVLYTFADPALEALHPLQKQMLRMGPDNMQALQRHLRQVQAAL